MEDAWIQRFCEASKNNNLYPGVAEHFEVPKAFLTTRPGILLSAQDQVLYSALALEFLPIVANAISWSDFGLRFSYRPAKDGQEWFKARFIGWKKFDERSLMLLDEFKYCLFTDVASYYENIDINRLSRELRAASVSQDCCTDLTRLLERCAGGRSRGIPHAFSPSHLLGEYFLNPVDEQLKANDVVHLRYVDDIRIFTTSKTEAQRACNLLERLLRSRGLNIQSAKTEVMNRTDAKKRLSFIESTLKKISEELIADLGSEAEYMSPSEILEEFSGDADSPSVKVLMKAWKRLSDGKIKFDKSVFHYIIKRLGKSDAEIADDFLLSLLESHPQETAYVLSYLSSRKLFDRESSATALCRILRNSASSPFQQSLIIKALVRSEGNLHQGVLEAARNLLGRTRDPILIPWLVTLIGQNGSIQGDVDMIDRVLSYSTDEMLRATCVWALRRRAKSTTSTIRARTKGESIWMEAALSDRE